MSIDDGSFASQDQVIGLIWGLAFINKLVPDNVLVNGVHLGAAAREMVHRLVWKLRSDGWA